MNQRDRRAITVGVAVVFCGWVGLRRVPRVLDWGQEKELEVSSLVQRIDQGRRATASLDVLSDSIAELERVAEVLPEVLLMGEDAGTAGFDLTRRVSLHASVTPAFVESVHPQPDDVRSGPLARASVLAVLETDLIGLTGLLERVEEDPSLAVTRLEIGAVDPGSSPDQQERLVVSFTVTGWYRPAASRPNTETSG